MGTKTKETSAAMTSPNACLNTLRHCNKCPAAKNARQVSGPKNAGQLIQKAERMYAANNPQTSQKKNRSRPTIPAVQKSKQAPKVAQLVSLATDKVR